MRRASLLVAGVIAIPHRDPVWPQHARPPHAPARRRSSQGARHPPRRRRRARGDRSRRARRIREARRAQAALAALPSVPSTTWVNLGPTDAPQEFNYFTIASVDSGRPNNIVVDPRDANVVYMAVSGGGVWKTFNFLSRGADVGADDGHAAEPRGRRARDRSRSSRHAVRRQRRLRRRRGDTILKSHRRRRHVERPVVARRHVRDGFGRARRLDPADRRARQHRARRRPTSACSRSTDARRDVHARRSAERQRRRCSPSRVWSVVQVGGGAWVAAGVTACAPGAAPPIVYFGFDADPRNVPGRQQRRAVALRRRHDLDAGHDDAADRSAPAARRSRSARRPIRRTRASTRSSATSTATRRSATGAPTTAADVRRRRPARSRNPTLVVERCDDTCTDIDVGHGQTWYNQAIVVDPTNADHVLVGGNLCGMRTLNGTAASPTWELVSHWLPGHRATARPRTAGSPYVHADWHTATSVVDQRPASRRSPAPTAASSRARTCSTRDAGRAGRVDSTTTTASRRTSSTRSRRAIRPTGNPFVAFSGLQDNGTRFRADPREPVGVQPADRRRRHRRDRAPRAPRRSPPRGTTAPTRRRSRSRPTSRVISRATTRRIRRRSSRRMGCSPVGAAPAKAKG